MNSRVPDWTRYTDHNGDFYFLHEDTGESRWMLPDSEQGVFIDGDEFEPEGRHQEWLKIRERYEAQQEEERAKSFDMQERSLLLRLSSHSDLSPSGTSTAPATPFTGSKAKLITTTVESQGTSSSSGTATPVFLGHGHIAQNDHNSVPIFDMNNVDEMYKNIDSGSSNNSSSSSEGGDSDTWIASQVTVL